MSVRQMSLAWQLHCASHTEKLVLVALADNANDQGVCWPSISTLAEKCNLTRRAVINQIFSLEKQGLVSSQRTIGRVTHYNLQLVNHVHQCTAFTSEPDSPVPVNHVHHHPCTAFTGPVNGVHPNHKEPSSQPSKEPSVEFSIPECLSSSDGFMESWEGFKVSRKQKKQPLTSRAAMLILRLLAQRPSSAADAMDMAVRHSWRGFEWAWYDNAKGKQEKRPYNQNI